MVVELARALARKTHQMYLKGTLVQMKVVRLR